MWLVTTRGFYSVVKADGDDDMVMVRARCKKDIDALADLLAGYEAYRTPEADYRWKVKVPRTLWAEVCAHLAGEIDYPNFKARIDQENRHRHYVYVGVWSRLLLIEDEDGVPTAT